jgi:RNA polymerase sigma-70 factor, ECF subfamily
VSQRVGAEAASRATSFAALCADDNAFSNWYDAALPRVYGFVYARTAGDAELAEDVTATAFLEAIRARGSFAGRSDPVTWICSIARNRLIDHYRSEARDRTRHLRLVVSELATDEQVHWDQVDHRDAALTSLAALPPIERNALILRYLDGYSVRETARLIGRSEPATESLLARARERVRSAFPGGPG